MSLSTAEYLSYFIGLKFKFVGIVYASKLISS